MLRGSWTGEGVATDYGVLFIYLRIRIGTMPGKPGGGEGAKRAVYVLRSPLASCRGHAWMRAPLTRFAYRVSARHGEAAAWWGCSRRFGCIVKASDAITGGAAWPR